MFYNQQTNCHFFDYYALLENAYQDAVDELLALNLIDVENIVIDFKDVNVRRIFHHHIIHKVCETIRKSTHEGFTVIYYHLPPQANSEFLNHIGTYDEKYLEKIIITITSDLFIYFPIIFYTGGRLSFSKFRETIENVGTGESQYHINSVLGVINSFDSTTYKFDKIKKLVKRRKLTFLSQHYFNQFSTKKLIYSR